MGVRARIVGALVALAVLTSCGSRVDPPADLSVGQTATSTETGGGGEGGGGDQVMFGTLASPCGPGEPSGGSLDVGVSDEKIVIGTIADPGGPVPGLNQGIHDSVVAFGDWCNAQGGINGRELEVLELDAKLFEYKQRVLESCDTAFALVGGLGVFDDTGAQDQVDCGLPNVPASGLSAAQAEADLTWYALPNPIYEYQVGMGIWSKENDPEAVEHAAAIYTDSAPTKRQKDRLVEAYTSIGFDFVEEVPVGIGETNWDPKVIAMKDAGVQWLTYTGTYEDMVGLQKAAADQDFDPVVELEANFYNRSYPEQAGSAADGSFIRLTQWPFEEAADNPAQAAYLEALEAAVPGAEPELLGVQAWSAALLFATAVDALGDDVTREGLAAELATVTEWDGGGLHGVTNPAENTPSSCFIVMRVADGGFVRHYPLPDEDAEVYEAGNGFACPPLEESTAILTGDYGTGAKAKGGG